MKQFDRRTLLRGAALGGGVAGLCGLAGALPGPWAGPSSGLLQEGPEGFGKPGRKTKHLVLIAFAGGVRSKETFGTPANVPTLQAMADGGVLYPRTRAENLGHYGAALSIFTGIGEQRGIRDNTRGPDPTCFEYIRKERGLRQDQIWISTSGGAQQTNYSHGLHPEYGPPFGANALDGDGIFNAEFKAILDAYGRPRTLDPQEQELLDTLRGGLGRDETGRGGRGADALKSSAEVERYILEELTRGTSDIRGANAADAKALRVARNLLSIFKPPMVSVVLQQADVAHRSYNAYLEIVRRNDAAIGELWSAVQQDPELAESTTFIVAPEFGRDADLNSRRGLDHGDGSDDVRYVSTVCWGPDFARGRVVQEEVGLIDLCPTVCDLAGVDPKLAKGRRLPRLMA